MWKLDAPLRALSERMLTSMRNEPPTAYTRYLSAACLRLSPP